LFAIAGSSACAQSAGGRSPIAIFEVARVARLVVAHGVVEAVDFLIRHGARQFMEVLRVPAEAP
jgi:hypothetical protein